MKTNLNLAALFLSLLTSTVALPVLSQQTTQGSNRASGPIKIDRIVAVVNDDALTASELNMRIAVTQKQLRRQNQTLPPEDQIARQVLERMITDLAMVHHARERGVRVDDQMVDQAIARMADENKTNLSGLRDRVERDGMPFSRFREDIRVEMVISRLREREVDAQINVSESEVDRFLAEQAGSADTTEYNIAQILLRVPEGSAPEVVERQRLRAEEIIRQLERGTEFARLSAAFSDAPDALNGGGMGWRTAERLPQLFLDAVRPLRINQVTPVLRSGNGFHILRVLDRRSTGLSNVSTPVQQTRAAHILMRVPDAASEAKVRANLEAIRSRVTAGQETFEVAARTNSIDGSASSGGDLGWILPGDTVPEFERAMNATPLNTISDPVRSQFGFHLILVKERKMDAPPTDRVRAQARQVVRERKAELQYQEWVQLIRDRAFVELKNDDS